MLNPLVSRSLAAWLPTPDPIIDMAVDDARPSAWLWTLTAGGRVTCVELGEKCDQARVWGRSESQIKARPPISER